MADITITLKRLQNSNQMLKRKKFVADTELIAKQRRNSGQSYTGKNGVFHENKEYNPTGLLCGSKCRKTGCLLEEEWKVDIFRQFWNTGSFNEQNDILARFMRKQIPAQNQTDGRRNATFHYFIPDTNGIQLPVCKTAFQTIFGVTERRIRTLQEKIGSRKLSLADERGRSDNRPNRLGPDVREAILSHINSYEKCLGHYSRKDGDPEREYLSKDLNIPIMFRDFAAAYGEEALSWEWVYRSIFRDTKLRFGTPMTDTCSKCDRYHTHITSLDESNENERTLEELWTACIEHQLNSENGYSELRNDINISKQDASYIVISVDLQGILLCPRLTNSEYYYQRKYACYNLAIHEGNSENTTMCFWHKREANRGSSEIASCIYKFCTEKFIPLNNNERRRLIVYSDRCVGQNNNFMLLTLYRFMVARKLFTEIDQKFITTGHSFLPCDRQFALVEKKQKTATIYQPNDWIQVIESANLVNPFRIQRMTQDQFFDFKGLSEKTRRPATLKVTESMWFNVSMQSPREIKSKEFLTDDTWTTHAIVRDVDLEHEELERSYNAPLPLPQLLVQDLKSMMEFLPNNSKEFWRFLDEN